MTQEQARADLSTITFELLSDSRLAESEGPSGSGGDAMQLKSIAERVLGPLLRSAPDAATAALQRGKYLVEFSSTGTEALRSGALQLLQRTSGRLQPTLTIPGGPIQENAVLIGGLAQTATAAMAVSHLVILLAVQAQLLSMEKSLQRIEKKVDSIRRWLHQEKLAQVKGRLRTLQELRDQLIANEWTQEAQLGWKIALDNAHVELCQLEELAYLQCKESLGAIDAMRSSVRVLGPTGRTIVAELAELFDRHQCNEELLLLVLLGRFAVARLRIGLGANVAVANLQDGLRRARDMSHDFSRLAHRHADEFSTWFKDAEFDKNTRKALRERALDARAHMDASVGEMEAQVRALQSKQAMPSRAFVEVADGAVTSLRVLGSAG
jgi:hypothetical protein